MPVDDSPRLLHLHEDHFKLARIVERFLPIAQPTYNTLISANHEIKVYASFKSDHEPKTEAPFVVLADFGPQIRPFCTIEADEAPSEDRLELGSRLIVQALREWAQHLVKTNQSDIVVVGAVHSWWGDAIKKAFGPLVAFGQYDTHLAPPPSIALGSQVELPAGYEFGTVREQDIEESEAKGNESNGHDSIILAASAFTHRDGSLGTMSVGPDFRRRGLAVLLVQERLRRERQWEIDSGLPEPQRSIAYVGATNAASKGVMRKSGWPVVWQAAWCRIDLAVMQKVQ
ncbi:hypothetical protein OIV83_002250 [Microbotryomycetes sp. JL201]|nr:hypothetical protein OIV83_002250 [Microbotryomycetes sp. JL201]